MMLRKNLTTNIINKYLIPIVSVCIGVLIGKYVSFPYFKIDEKINLVYTLSIFINLLSALYIAHILDGEKQKNKNEKELILNRTDHLNSIIDETLGKIDSSSINYSEAAFNLKRLHTSVDNVYKLLSEVGIRVDETPKAAITENLRGLRDLLTNTPAIENQDLSNSPTSVSQGMIYFNDYRKIEIKQGFDSLRDSILKLQLEINRAS
jgi:hypothetical protein